jgi:hypothetical protein
MTLANKHLLSYSHHEISECTTKSPKHQDGSGPESIVQNLLRILRGLEDGRAEESRDVGQFETEPKQQFIAPITKTEQCCESFLVDAQVNSDNTPIPEFMESYCQVRESSLKANGRK